MHGLFYNQEFIVPDPYMQLQDSIVQINFDSSTQKTNRAIFQKKKGQLGALLGHTYLNLIKMKMYQIQYWFESDTTKEEVVAYLVYPKTYKKKSDDFIIDSNILYTSKIKGSHKKILKNDITYPVAVRYKLFNWALKDREMIPLSFEIALDDEKKEWVQFTLLDNNKISPFSISIDSTRYKFLDKKYTFTIKDFFTKKQPNSILSLDYINKYYIHIPKVFSEIYHPRLKDKKPCYLTKPYFEVFEDRHLLKDCLLSHCFNYPRKCNDKYIKPDVEPKFPLGKTRFETLLVDTIFTEDVNQNATEEYSILCYIVIYPDGTIEAYGCQSEDTSCNTCQKKVLQIIKDFPKWIPAKKNNKEVHSVYHNIPFKIYRKKK